ncbi:MAG: hypothetical protein PHD58_03335, partial [Anaerolineales bacterium]|nr:hypothetical protein [Anaerolineales bacterium]
FLPLEDADLIILQAQADDANFRSISQNALDDRAQLGFGVIAVYHDDVRTIRQDTFYRGVGVCISTPTHDLDSIFLSEQGFYAQAEH